MPISICYCYAREDTALLDKLRKHLEPMKSSGIITTWYDNAILPGTEFDSEVTKQMYSADLLLLLASANFVTSKYYGPKLNEVIQQRQSKPGILVLLRPFDWEGMLPGLLNRLRILPSDMRPVTRWRDRDEAFWDVSKGIRKIISEVNPETEIQLPHLPVNDKNSLKGIRKILANCYRRAIFTQTNEEDSYEDMIKSLRNCRIFLQKNIVYVSSKEAQALVAEIIGELDFIERLQNENGWRIILAMDQAKLRIITALTILSKVADVPFVLPTSLTGDSLWREGDVDKPPKSKISPEHERLLQSWEEEEY